MGEWGVKKEFVNVQIVIINRLCKIIIHEAQHPQILLEIIFTLKIIGFEQLYMPQRIHLISVHMFETASEKFNYKRGYIKKDAQETLELWLKENKD